MSHFLALSAGALGVGMLALLAAALVYTLTVAAPWYRKLIRDACNRDDVVCRCGHDRSQHRTICFASTCECRFFRGRIRTREVSVADLERELGIGS